MEQKHSVLLPITNFPISRTTSRDSEILNSIWTEQPEDREGAKQFVLHDGPPYANGSLHIGHALNKILKDWINRLKKQQGYKPEFLPGWDCHGLPIEHAVEKQHGRITDPLKLRPLCRDFAAYYVEKQRNEALEYGLIGEFDKPYTTMQHRSEIVILKNVHELAKKGMIYRAEKPVWWSYSEQTSLAEAEVEQKTVRQIAIDVGFSVEGQSLIVPAWTTTPWNIFANEAVAFSLDVSYSVYKTASTNFVVADELAEKFFSRIDSSFEHVRKINSEELLGFTLINPAQKQVKIVAGGFVKSDIGTGFVHISPSHSPDDFAIGKEHNLPCKSAIDKLGFILYEPLTEFAGKQLRFTDSAETVCEFLGKSLLSKEYIEYSSTISWRSKKPVVYLATPQWFLDIKSLTEKALAAIDTVEWVPSSSKNRISSMVKNRPDWCISRQRLWGTPLAVFYHKDTGKICEEVLDVTLDFLDKNGIDTWFQDPYAALPEPNPKLVAEKDIVDVWVEAGLTNAILLDRHPELEGVDLCLEGTDQHRAWFQASLLLKVALHDCAPYRTVVTHGFVVDRKGLKMSKSEGNVVDPKDIIEKHGADTLRLMVTNVSIGDDMRCSQELLEGAKTQLARFRLTLRYLLGNISYEFDQDTEMLDFERWILSRMHRTSVLWYKHLDEYDTSSALKLLYKFCDEELSAIYFASRKDTLYCEKANHPARQSALKCMNFLFQTLVRLISPIAPFMAEEAWQEYKYKDMQSVHSLQVMDTCSWEDKELEDKYTQALSVKDKINVAIEKLREAKTINQSHAADVTGPLCGFTAEEMQSLCIVTKYSESDRIQALPAAGEKCTRCRFYDHCEAGLCRRCCEVVSQHDHCAH